jgi:hypothetical protein
MNEIGFRGLFIPKPHELNYSTLIPDLIDNTLRFFQYEFASIPATRCRCRVAYLLKVPIKTCGGKSWRSVKIQWHVEFSSPFAKV